jgi:hypothetical protein
VTVRNEKSGKCLFGACPIRDVEVMTGGDEPGSTLRMARNGWRRKEYLL